MIFQIRDCKNLCVLHSRQISYHLNHWGSPFKEILSLKYCKRITKIYRKSISEINLEKTILTCPSNSMSVISFTYKNDHLKWTCMYAFNCLFTKHFCYTWKSDKESVYLKLLLRQGNHLLDPSTTNIIPKKQNKRKIESFSPGNDFVRGNPIPLLKQRRVLVIKLKRKRLINLESNL